MSRAVKLLVVGAGWRARFFLDLASRLPEQLEVAGAVVRRPEAADEVRARWAVPVYSSVTEALSASRPEFAVAAVPWAATPEVITTAVEHGVPVLAETPPAPDLPGLRALWSAVGASGLVQVAEQYLLLPGHAARRALVSRGIIGQPTSVQVSSTHGYHAVSMIRGLLGAGFGPAAVRAGVFRGPLVNPLTRQGWTDDDTEQQAETTIATIDFGGAMGLYDFTANQWHNPLRTRRILIRGSRGEISGDQVTRLSAAHTIVTSALTRRQTGYDLDLDGYDTQHISFEGEVVYRNPFEGLRLADEEIAIATITVATANWVRGEGPPPYPLAQACQDHLLALAIEESAASGGEVRTVAEAWAPGGN